ncbi:Response regulator receiver domain-containing protein [Paucidesulfovibrio gracilis DSM 16080]|uniref:Response regulator receiver domain-containing protein n=1 Tax=Paucidesulfovibrio gracilis DSM 16080 TaxID=1121449 RepID=A0A1T4W1J1_9BACT|nr:response regulator [Paucidesulfovibrio gracilis]SKA70918.1 Response regulator receiver domain-containing protein [Paucidesulfovibrio gracilis DSM 16080]
MSKVKVLVVDDEQDFVKLFVKRFLMRNLDVRGVNSGQEALEYLRSNDIDVVVLDVKMPGMDGLETLQEIKKRHPHVEVIMLTGHGSVKSGIQGISLGAYDYVLKPFKIEDLLGRILKAYERSRLNRGRQP